ncbi:MAG: hypothetical protein GY940_30725, partial [bacterium]|nr:hypothetical protein [bacterium]
VRFCDSLRPRFHYWGIRAPGPGHPNAPGCIIEELASGYIEKIKHLQPHGPYFIAGWSLGGTIAFEMALQLEQAGETLSFLGLIDSPAPQKQGRENNNGVDIPGTDITDHLARLMPNYDRLKAGELKGYINTYNSLIRAREIYKPAEKVSVTPHYFEAQLSRGLFRGSWNDYCLQPITPVKIPGDHFSIFKEPNIKETAKIFENILP